jgi:hypothetical protein
MGINKRGKITSEASDTIAHKGSKLKRRTEIQADFRGYASKNI